MSCIGCKHFDITNWLKGNMAKCKAFPKTIPLSIGSGLLVHNKTIKGQEGKYVMIVHSVQCCR